jgi:hypothetical protein
LAAAAAAGKTVGLRQERVMCSRRWLSNRHDTAGILQSL